ncbi:MAG: ATP-binding protein [Parachlamydiaceae bacterium]
MYEISLIESSIFDIPIIKEYPETIFMLVGFIAILCIVLLFALFMRYRTLKKAREMTQALQESTSLYQAIINGTNYSIILTEPNGVIKSVNSGASRLLGYTPEELMGKFIPSTIHDSEEVKKRAEELSKELGYVIEPGFEVFAVKARLGIADEREWTYIRKDGSRFPVHLSVTAIRNEEETITGFLGIASDLTEQKKNNFSLTNITQRLKFATESAKIGIWDWNLETQELIWNDVMFKLYGIDTPFISGTYDIWENSLDPEDKERTVNDVWTAIHNNTQFDTTFHIIWPDKSVHVIRSIADTIKYQNDKPIKMIGVNWDVTERQRIDEMKTEFVSTVSHELRTPLTSIRGAIGLITSGTLGDIPEKIKPLAKIALSNCERLSRLINDILDTEKIAAGKINCQMKLIDLKHLILQAIADSETQAKDYEITICKEIPDQDLNMYADLDRIHQVLLNLISNAIKFSRKGDIVKILPIVTKNRTVRINVIDNGPGIPEEFKPHIFKKFSQADQSSKRKKSGTGLGLSICKGIIEQHGGIIDYESSIGKGSTFYFELPLLTETPLSLSNETITHKAQVLVCESDPDLSTLIRLMLEQKGCEVDVACSSTKAINLIKEKSYVSLILDVNLFNEDGAVAMKKLTLEPAITTMPIIAISTKSVLEKKELHCESLNIVDWIEKPINYPKFLKTIDRILGRTA